MTNALRSELTVEQVTDRLGPDARMLPAEGQVAASVRERAVELLRYHDERFLAITAVLEVLGHLDVLEVRGTLRSTEDRGVSHFALRAGCARHGAVRRR